MSNSLDTEMREPSYWWGILRTHDLHGRDLSVEKRVREIYQSYTAEQLQQAFKKYYTAKRTYRVTAVPTGATARCGGWGPVCGDEGSGAWIGRRALSVVTAAADGREPRPRCRDRP